MAFYQGKCVSGKREYQNLQELLDAGSAQTLTPRDPQITEIPQAEEVR